MLVGYACSGECMDLPKYGAPWRYFIFTDRIEVREGMSLMWTQAFQSNSTRIFFFFSSRRRHTRSYGDWSSDVCSSDLMAGERGARTRQPRIGVGDTQQLGHHGAALGTVVRNQHGSGALMQLLDRGETHQIGRASCRERG